jgi:hypothetical protein
MPDPDVIRDAVRAIRALLEGAARLKAWSDRKGR